MFQQSVALPRQLHYRCHLEIFPKFLALRICKWSKCIYMGYKFTCYIKDFQSNYFHEASPELLQNLHCQKNVQDDALKNTYL